MKYYSEITRKNYDTAEDCEKAEQEVQQLELKKKLEKERESSERKVAAEKVEAARKEMIKAQKAYKEELDSFISKYRSYHFTSTKLEDVPVLFDSLFRFF